MALKRHLPHPSSGWVGLLCAIVSSAACGRPPDPPTSAEEEAPVATAISVDRRSPEHLASRWEFFEAGGPFSVVPSRRAFRESVWGSQQLHLFAALYPREPFESIEDFKLFTRYTSSIQQFLIRDGEADLDWFMPEAQDEAVPRFLASLKATPRLSGEDALDMILRWGLPGEFGWISELTIGDTFADASDEGLELTAETDEGYLCMFALLD